MGVDLQTYRARVGGFIPPASKTTKQDTYNPRCYGTDVHWRTLMTCFVLLGLVCVTYGFMRGKYEFVTYHASSCAIEDLHACIDHITMARYTDACHLRPGYYSSFYSRLLLLSADVELNPGPVSDTELILKAIEESNNKMANDIRGLKDDIAGLKTDISGVKTELKSVSEKVAKIDERQKTVETDVKTIQSQISDIEYNAGIMHADVGALSVNDERRDDQIDKILNQLNGVDREMRKCNLRIFGIPDGENETQKETKLKVMSSVLNAAASHSDVSDAPDPDSCLISARRLGQFNKDKNKPRAILAKFRNPDDKFSLFSIRDKLRENGIKIANDLTPYEKEQLDRLKQQGRRGYFSRGKLMIVDENLSNNSDNRMFRRATRRLPTQPTLPTMHTIPADAEAEAPVGAAAEAPDVD